jgi:hypothetical protein
MGEKSPDQRWSKQQGQETKSADMKEGYRRPSAQQLVEGEKGRGGRKKGREIPRIRRSGGDLGGLYWACPPFTRDDGERKGYGRVKGASGTRPEGWHRERSWEDFVCQRALGCCVGCFWDDAGRCPVVIHVLVI